MKKRGLTDPAHMFDPLDIAAYDTVHDFKGGADALVKVVGGSAEVLRNKVNPRMDSHKLGLKEARSLMLASRDFRILETLASDCGFVIVTVEKFNATGDVGLLEQSLEIDEAHGQFAGDIHQALIDGKLTKVEIRKIRARAQGMLKATEGMIARLDACADD